MHKATPAMSRLPSGTFDAKAMQSSALAAAAANLPTSGSQEDGVFSVLDNLPLAKERRQLDALTRFLTEVNQAAKRDAVTRRQLGAVKSAPEAVGQLGSVLAAAENLPIKRGEGEGFDDIGGLGHFLSGLAGRAENGGIGDLTGLSGALNGLAKRELEELEDLVRRGGGDGGLSDIVGIIGGLAKRGGSDGGLGGLDGIIGGNEKKENPDNEHYAKHGDALHGMFHKAGEGKDKESQGTPNFQEAYGLGQLAKRQDGVNLGDASSLIDNVDLGAASQFTERDGMLEGLDGWEGLLDDADILDVLGLLGRDYPASTDDMLEKREGNSGIGGLGGLGGVLNGLAKREDMTDEHVKRQLGAAGAIASGALSNAGTAVSHLGKLASGKVRRTSLQGGQADPVAAPMLPLEATKLKDTSNDDDMNGPEEIAKEVASGEATAEEATKTIGSSANRGIAKGPLGKRQVPPIAGADLPTVVKGIAANPSIALAPVTQGVKLAGTGLGDFFKN